MFQILVNLLVSRLLFSSSIQINVEKFTNEQGLSQNSIIWILQDKRGFLWFGTYDGLNRYDGYNFKVYKLNPNDPYSISHNGIWEMFEDSKGELWIGTTNGLNRYDRDKDQFIQYKNDPDNSKSLSGSYITAIYEDRQGTLWIGTRENGLNRLVNFDHETNQMEFAHYKHNPDDPNTLSFNAVYSIFEDRRGNLWLGTATALNLYDRTHDQIVRFKNYPNDSKNPNFENIDAIIEDHQGSLWISSNNGLNRINFPPETEKGIIDENHLKPDDVQFIHYASNPANPDALGNNIINDLFPDNSHYLWIGTNNGLFLYDFAADRFITVDLCEKNKKIQGVIRVTSIYEDKSGVLWIGTDFGGLFKYNKWKAQFRHHKKDDNNPGQSINDNTVMAIYEDADSVLWIGTFYGGLNRYDRKTNKYTCYLNDPNDPASLSHDAVRAIYKDKAGRFWVGTSEGLNILDEKTNKFTRYMPNSNNIYGLKSKNIWSIGEDRFGTIWIGTFNLGLFRLDAQQTQTKEKKFIQYVNQADDPYSLSGNIVWAILEDRKGVLWIATDRGGLNKFDRENNRFVSYKTNPMDSSAISGNQVLCLLEDHQGNLWAGTTAGLNKLVPAVDENSPPTFVHYKEANGLPGNTIQALIEDNSGHIWISTNKGLSRFNPETGVFKNFDYNDNLQSNEFTVNCCCKNTAGELFFGGVNGYNSFFPDSIKENQVVPQVVIIDFLLFNQSVPTGLMKDGRMILDKSIVETDKILLSYEDKVFSFEFAALHFCSPEDNKYAYIMEGFEPNWNYARNRRFVTYTSLPPGDYVFHVKASNNDDKWNEKGISVKIKITPPFWQTLWFRVISLFAVLFAIVGVYNFRTWTIRKRNRELEDYVEQHTLELKQKNLELQQEIHERQKAEEEIEAEREKLVTTLRSIGEGVITIDNEGRVVILNKVAEELTGWSQNDAFAKPFDLIFNIYDEISHEPFLKDIAQVLQANVDIDTSKPCTLKAREGTEHIIIFSGAHILDKTNAVMGMVFVFHDISEQRRVEMELQKASKLESIGILAGGIAHDFNNILTVIMSSVSLAKAKLKGQEEIDDILSDAERASIRAQDLTQQLLTFSKGGTPIKDYISISELIKESTKFALRGSRVKYELSLPPDLWTIQADKGQISQVINNLIINANQAMPNGGTVQVLAENVEIAGRTHLPIKPGKYVKISVKDHGIGIHKEHLTKIFDPYFTTKQTGSGIGLTTSYSIVNRHEGCIDLESKLGEGTTFYVYLPTTDQISFVGNEIKNLIPFGRGRILLMDDEPVVRRTASRILEWLGYQVEFAEDGEAAIRTYKQSLESQIPFDLIILDLTIPGGMGGKEVLAQLRKLDPKVRAIVSSGYSNDPVMANPEDYGFVGVVKKPYRINELAGELMNVLKRGEGGKVI